MKIMNKKGVLHWFNHMAPNPERMTLIKEKVPLHDPRLQRKAHKTEYTVIGMKFRRILKAI